MRQIRGLLLLTAFIPAIASGAAQWAKEFGGTTQDETVTTVLQTNDGGFIAGGNVYDEKADKNYALVIKLDASGTILWQKRYSSKTLAVFVTVVLPAPDGGYLVVAWAFDAKNEDLSYGFLMKIDANGKQKWQKRYSPPNASGIFYTARETPDGGYIATGFLQEPIGSEKSAGWIVKVDGAGAVQWQRRYSTTHGCGLFYAEQTSDGGYIAAGAITVSSTTGDGDAWIVRLSSSGDLVWQKRYGSKLTGDGLLTVRQTAEGGYVAAGYYADDGEDSSAAWIVKLDAAGTVKWQKACGGKYYDYNFFVDPTTDGGYVTSGLTGPTAESLNASIMRFDATGTLLWRRTLKGGFQGLAFTVRQTPDGGYVSGCYATASEDDSNGIVLKLNPQGNISTTCGSLLGTDKLTVSNTSTKALNTTGTTTNTSASVATTDFKPYSSKATTKTLCQSRDLEYLE